MMRFLLLNQYYPPDPAPTGVYLRDLARAMVAEGHEVRVVCSRRGYDGGNLDVGLDLEDGVQVHRLRASGFGRRGFPGKVADYLSFGALLAGVLARFRPSPDLILSLTTPPYLGLAGRAAAARHGCRHAHWVMDLYPDVLSAHGLMQATSRFYRALGWLTRIQLRGASAVVALGPVMAEKVKAYGAGARESSRTEVGSGGEDSMGGCVHSVPLWSLAGLGVWPAESVNPLRSARGWRVGELVLLYSGNMGLGHRFGEFLGAAERLGSEGPRWVFFGGGKRRSEVERFVRDHPKARVEVHDYVPSEQLSAHLSSADVHLASLDRSWQGMMVPSKLQASFAVGRPVLFVGGRENETARWIEESGGGWIVDENDVRGLIEAVGEAGDPSERRRRGVAARTYAERHFDRVRNCGRLVRLLSAGVSVAGGIDTCR